MRNIRNTGWVLSAAMLVILSQGQDVSAQANSDKGVGPVKELKLEPLSSGLAAKGKAVFTAKCSACHKFEERYVGPALQGITQRRAPEWVMNMILNPAEMLQSNETAQELLAEFLTPMPFQNITQDEARSVYEYFRQADSKPAAKK